MRQVTFAGLRAHRSRFVAVSIAVMLAVAFMAATLLLDSSSKATLRASLGAEYQHADLIIESSNANYVSVHLTEEVADQIRQIPGVSEVGAAHETWADVSSTTRQVPFVTIRQQMSDALEPAVITQGRFAEAADEVVLSETSLGLLEVGLGDTITVHGFADDAPVSIARTIVGVAKASQNPFSGASNSALVSQAGFAEIETELFGEQNSMLRELLVQLDSDRLADEVIAHIGTLQFVDLEGNETRTPTIHTVDERVADQVNQFTDGTDVLTAVLLAFVGIALFVAGLVISNTFSVLVAQRSRELALLRCVGASTRQVYRSVLSEAFVMALIASLLGVALAAGLMAGLVWIAAETGLAGGVGVFALSWQAVVLPIVAGVLVTLIAANGPAREATRVAPLEALRARSAESFTKRAGAMRLIVGLLFLVIGGALIVPGVMLSDATTALALVLFGSVLTAVGVLMLMVFVVPRITYWLGRLFMPKGVPGRLAALNVVRNPKRTAATAGALLVGVTLVATVYTGAEVARVTLTNELASAFPVDLALVVPQGMTMTSEGGLETLIDEPVSDEALELLEAVEGVEALAGATSAYIDVEAESGVTEVWGVDPDEFALVTRDSRAVLRAGEALLGNAISSDEVTLSGEAGMATLEARQAGAPRYTAILTPEDFASIGVDHGTSVVLIRVSDALGAAELLEIRDELVNIVPSSYVIGEGIERAMFDEIIQTLLLIVTALLAVAVFIAVIGIGNTLALSVIERTRENALMRALGLTRGQLRGTLAAEALFTAFTAALFGVILGVLYGFAGATAILNSMGEVAYVVPWGALGVILVAALVAGLLASVLPARRAAKLSPVEGLQSV